MPLHIPVQPVIKKYKCFGCLHVRTGTLLLAFYQTILHFIVILAMTSNLVKLNAYHDDDSGKRTTFGAMSFVQWEWAIEFGHNIIKEHASSTGLPTSSDRVNKSFYDQAPPPQISPGDNEQALSGIRNSSLYKEEKPFKGTSELFFNAGQGYVPVAITLISLLFTLLLFVGTFYCRPYYLLPYNLLQLPIVFGLCVSGLLLLIVKGYFFNMTWLCYNFLIRLAGGVEQYSGFAFAENTCPGWCQLCTSQFGIRFSRTRSHNSSYRSDFDRPYVLELLHNLVAGGSTTLSTSHSFTEQSIGSNLQQPPPKYEDVVSGSERPPTYTESTRPQHTPGTTESAPSNQT